VFESVQRLSRSNFKDGGVYVEKYVERARHVEVQLFGDGRGGVLALGERDCSLQRRHQKVVEETPAPRLPAATRAAMHAAAVRLGQHVAYESAGTVEFIYDDDGDAFYFLEVNTRLQVEHGVTEAVTGVDLVEWMVRQAAGELAPLAEIAPSPRGAAIQVRLYAEDPGKNFLPACGRLTHVAFPADARVDGWVETGTEITPHYDPMLAKIIVHGDDRDAALACLRAALAATECGASRPTSPTSRRSPTPSSSRPVGSAPARWPRSPSRPRRSTSSRPAHRAVCRTGPAASASGTSACRRAGRWIRSRTASPTASSATPGRPRRSR
jgi:urea carboxylase